MQSTGPESGNDFSFSDRYGIRPRVRWFVPALILGITGVIWVIWAGLHVANPEIRSEVISYSVTGEREISLRYTIDRADPTAIVICTLVAKDIDKTVVGQIDDTIIAGESRVVRLSPIPTRSTPVTAGIDRCRVG
jgi:hypothetical protein